MPISLWRVQLTYVKERLLFNWNHLVDWADRRKRENEVLKILMLWARYVSSAIGAVWFLMAVTTRGWSLTDALEAKLNEGLPEMPRREAAASEKVSARAEPAPEVEPCPPAAGGAVQDVAGGAAVVGGTKAHSKNKASAGRKSRKAVKTAPRSASPDAQPAQPALFEGERNAATPTPAPVAPDLDLQRAVYPNAPIKPLHLL